MNRDNPTLRWLVWPVTLVTLGPLLYVMLMSDWFGIIPVAYRLGGGGSWLWLLMLAGYAVPVVISLRWRRVGLAFSLLVVLSYFQVSRFMALAREPNLIRVHFGDAAQESDIEVYCNGVHLGRTPFKMSEAEFRAKVAPWTNPPDQPIVSYHQQPDGRPYQNDFQSWQWTWTPGDPFDWPMTAHEFHDFDNPQELASYLKTVKYWWRFEKDGCVTLRSMNAFSAGGGGGRVITLHASLGVNVPAGRKMYPLLISALRASDYHPSTEWTAFVMKYRDELFPPLINESEKDRRLAGALNEMADAHFQWDQTADLASSRVVLDRLFASVSDPEQEDFVWLARRTGQRLVKKYPQLLVERTWHEVTPNPSAWQANYRRDSRFRRDLLLDLLSETSPPELFGLLVYLHGLEEHRWFGEPEPRLLAAIGNSGRSEAVPLLRNYLYKVWKEPAESKFIHDRKREGSVRMMIKVYHPELESEFWQLVCYKIKPDHFNQYSVLPQFIQSRIDRGIDLDQLTGRLLSCESLTDEQKGPFLAQINHPSAGVWLQNVADRLGDYKRNEMMDEVCELPANPATGRFLIDTWRRSFKLQGNSIRPNWNLAIWRIDTPEVRELILERLKTPDPPNHYPQWNNFTDLPDPIVPGRLAHHNWLLAEFRQTAASRRNCSLRILLEIGTPEALGLLREWADDPKNEVSASARDALKRPARQAVQATKQAAEMLSQVNDLLAGRIKPDNLLPPFPSAKWTGKTYEPKVIPKAVK